FAVSRPSWQWSVVAEVFSLNLFVGLFSLTASFHCANSAPQRSRVAHWGALCCGPGPCNQHTLVLYVVVIIPRVLLHLCSHKVSLTTHRRKTATICCWGDQTSLSGLLTHLQRTEYGTFSLVHTYIHLHLLNVLLTQGVVPWLLMAMLLLYSLFFIWRFNLDTISLVEQFWLQSDAVVCVLAGLGLSWTHTGLGRRLGHGGLWRAGGLCCVPPRECDQSSNSVVEQFGRELLVSVPPDSIILTRGDLPGNSLHSCLLTSLLLQMMTYSWYVAKLGQHHPGVHFPGRWWDPVHTEEKDTFSLEQFLSHYTQGAVLACIGLPDRDPSWERSFSHWLLGVCDHLVPAQEPFHPEEWTRHTLYIWTEPHNRYTVYIQPRGPSGEVGGLLSRRGLQFMGSLWCSASCHGNGHTVCHSMTNMLGLLVRNPVIIHFYSRVRIFCSVKLFGVDYFFSVVFHNTGRDLTDVPTARFPLFSVL
uniref:Transmembrane protein 260 n=1 Tax=Oncorhynchus mykiss TaxID=8022 RepID=A0A8K9UVG5_ONCMY